MKAKLISALDNWWHFRVSTCYGRPLGRVLVFLTLADTIVWSTLLIVYAFAASRKDVEEWPIWVIALELTVLATLVAALISCAVLAAGIPFRSRPAIMTFLVSYPIAVVSSFTLALALAAAYANFYNTLLLNCSETGSEGALGGLEEIEKDSDQDMNLVTNATYDYAFPHIVAITSKRKRLQNRAVVDKSGSVDCVRFAQFKSGGQELTDILGAGPTVLGIFLLPHFLLWYTTLGYYQNLDEIAADRHLGLLSEPPKESATTSTSPAQQGTLRAKGLLLGKNILGTGSKKSPPKKVVVVRPPPPKGQALLT